ncbi:transforming growth factor beta-1 proprotein isoform X1 [Strigops habroptila]|uniref:transforming growth factor beta-1 proprotein isoform X1 n=1 Tax=Strigops habroptila TaxID=2489341 RepID=UPI0011CFBB15|nr:transforming growth factor beta-1 proprotein isoform X1 [Strigops habroptila]
MELALLLAVLGAARALSTCRSLDLEAARRKRIEAVRGQILSKLRLTAPPPAPPHTPSSSSSSAPPALPEDVRALYNSTWELLQQRARGAPPPAPEDYYAKELHRFPMEPPGDAAVGRGAPPGRALLLRFNASRVRAELGPGALLHRAELRLLRQRAPEGGDQQRLELYQGFGNASWRYLQGRWVQAAPDEEWLWFDVTEAVQQWLRGNEPLGTFKLSVHCPCDEPGPPPPMRITIEGFEQQRGDMQSIAQKHRRVPYVLAMVLPPERGNDLRSARRRRGLEPQFCFGPPAPQRPTAAAAPPGRRSRAAACGRSTSTSGGTCSGAGSTSPAATWPTSAAAPAPTSGARTRSTPRCWRCTTSTTRGARPRRAACRRAWTRCPSSTTWGARRAWSSSRTWWCGPASAADPGPAPPTPSTPNHPPNPPITAPKPPKTPQNHPKSAQNSPKTPKITPKQPKTDQNSPEHPKITPETAQNTPNHPQTAPKQPKITPETAQNTPKSPPKQPKTPPNQPKPAQNPPKTAQTTPKSSPNQPKTPPNQPKTA